MTYRNLSDVIKPGAQALQKHLANEGQRVSLPESYTLVAKMLGYENYAALVLDSVSWGNYREEIKKRFPKGELNIAQQNVYFAIMSAP
jgi:hypothetical protein